MRRRLPIVQARSASIGVVRLVDVVAVEAEAGFEAQRIAGAEADRRIPPARPSSRRANPVRIIGGQRNLEPVLAGIAGARHQAVPAVDRDLRGAS